MPTVADVMTPFLQTVRLGESIAAVRDAMAEQGVHAVPIVDGYGELCGIVSTADLVEGWSPSQPVEQIMTRNVKTVESSAEVTSAAYAMLDAGIHHLVVADGASLVGMLSSWDLLRCLADLARR